MTSFETDIHNGYQFLNLIPNFTRPDESKSWIGLYGWNREIHSGLTNSGAGWAQNFKNVARIRRNMGHNLQNELWASQQASILTDQKCKETS